ncbi:MAG: hypothetical protein ACI8PP_002490 [Candidatus Pseudothioglobus sp.]|jgi:hypothetical protein
MGRRVARGLLGLYGIDLLIGVEGLGGKLNCSGCHSLGYLTRGLVVVTAPEKHLAESVCIDR